MIASDKVIARHFRKTAYSRRRGKLCKVAPKIFRYVGPEHVRAAAAHEQPGTEIQSIADLERWLEQHAAEREATGTAATFTVSLDGRMRLASRRSEHVACAGGLPVLSAGEISFDGRPSRVTAVSNLST